MFGLISLDEQKKLVERLKDYYLRLHPGLVFTVQERSFSKEEIGNLFFSYSGEEILATADLKIELISEALNKGYNTPIVVLQKGDKFFLIDGHRRAIVAFNFGISWNAFVLIPNKPIDLGIEKFVLGKVKDIVKKFNK